MYPHKLSKFVSHLGWKEEINLAQETKFSLKASLFNFRDCPSYMLQMMALPVAS